MALRHLGNTIPGALVPKRLSAHYLKTLNTNMDLITRSLRIKETALIGQPLCLEDPAAS
jgi:hypothetical protein